MAMSVVLGPHWSFNYRNDPKRLNFVLARYRFVSEFIREGNRVLELGCSDGIGVELLSSKASYYLGIDLDKPALDHSYEYLSSERREFKFDDFMDKEYGVFDVVTSLDVIEHVHQEYEETYFRTAVKNLSKDGVFVVGTPNITSSPFASPQSEAGHVNLYSQSRLIESCERFFETVIPFGMNDEVVHTGYGNMSHYLLCVCAGRKS